MPKSKLFGIFGAALSTVCLSFQLVAQPAASLYLPDNSKTS